MSTLPNWGSLTKAVDDDTTIDEAIAAAIADHDADSAAHLDDGASLASHKSETMIDHPAGSVASDKLPQKRFIASVFESLDGWATFKSGTGNIYLNYPGVVFQSGATSGGLATMLTGSDGFPNFDAGSDFYYKTVARLSAATTQTARFGIGADGLGDGISGVGFKVVNGTLYGYYIDDEDETTEEISGVTVTDAHVYEIRYEAATHTFSFFVDGVQQIQMTHTFSEPLDDDLFMFLIQSSGSGAHNLYISDVVAELQIS